ncbi:PAS domain-containing protein [Sphingobium sp.]|uniref:PAS domain-containing protein n=1 Tax=Sphingobium sp. TaxID=1912891 RepID=UPI002615D65F|nr:PAS domain-containing protein [Sphingobium sp.]
MRNFAHWREVGAKEPVLVTHHGRETHILIGMEPYARLAGAKAPTNDQDRTRNLANHIHQGLILCKADLSIDFVNPVALSMAKRWDRQLEGKPLFEALPEFSGAVTEAHIRHTLASGEASTADIPSPFRKDSWLHFETFSFGSGVAILLRDITDDMQHHRLADIKTSILKAMALHDGVSYIRISMRGFVDVVDDSFCEMMGLPCEKLIGVALPDLIAMPARRQLREDLEQVLNGQGDRRVATQFLSNRGDVVPVDASLVRLHGTYGTEGAVMVIIPQDHMQPAT